MRVNFLRLATCLATLPLAALRACSETEEAVPKALSDNCAAGMFHVEHVHPN